VNPPIPVRLLYFSHQAFKSLSFKSCTYFRVLQKANVHLLNCMTFSCGGHGGWAFPLGQCETYSPSILAYSVIWQLKKHLLCGGKIPKAQVAWAIFCAFGCLATKTDRRDRISQPQGYRGCVKAACSFRVKIFCNNFLF